MKLFLTAFVMMATVSLVACGDDDKPENSSSDPEQYTESSTFALIYAEHAVAAGDTVVYTRTSQLAVVNFDIVNKTQQSHDAYFRVEKLEGPAYMNDMGFCTDVCDNFSCPFTAPSPAHPFTIPAGGTEYFDFQFQGTFDTGTTALYKIVCGSGEALEDPQVFFLRIIM